jgi:hypothetical protein
VQTLSVCGTSRQWWSRQHCRLALKPAMLSKPILSVGGSSQLRWLSHHCRLVSQSGYVGDGNTVGWSLQPAVMARPTLPAWYTNRQWCLEQHCWLVALTGSAVFTISFSYFIVFIIYFIFFSWNQVSLYIRYIDDRSINIKHYKCYGYSSNVLIKILIPQNKKEIIIF